MENQRVDGRTARRDRNREAVLDAVLDLFGEENLSPGVHQVAERSGVSLRSVYRYFEDLNELIGAAIDRQLDRARPLFRLAAAVGEGSLDERIERFSTARVALFEEVRVVYRAAGVLGTEQSQVAAGLTASRGWLAEQSQAMFAPELDALSPEHAATAGMLVDVIGQFDTLEHLRGDRRLSPEETTAFVAAALRLTLT